MPSESVNQTHAAPNRKLWVYGFLLILILGALGYYGMMSSQDRSTNHDYYRVLYEASNKFNENLLKLDRMHKSKQSLASIRSLLPSYKRDTDPLTAAEKKAEEKEKKEAAKTFRYKIVGQNIKVTSDEDSTFRYKLEFEDILPGPKKGFSQYLFADASGQVLATVGGERTISIVELSSINQQIQRKNKQFQLNLSESGDSGSSNRKPPLPSYSNHVDMKISYGEFRVYVFPFSIDTTLLQEKKETTTPEKSADNRKVKSLDKIYLVGLLPQHKLKNRGSGGWNVSLLIVTLVSLVFIWCMLRLFLLPKNQSISRSYRVFTTASSYLFFIVIIALTLAFLQKSLLQIKKDNSAVYYADYLRTELNHDINDVFTSLGKYRAFYSHILGGLDKLPILSPESGPLSDDQTKDFNQSIENAIRQLNDEPCVAKGKNKIIADRMPGHLGTPVSNFKIKYNCALPKSDPGFVTVDLSSETISVMHNAYSSNETDQDKIDFYANYQNLNDGADGSISTSVRKDFKQAETGKILSVFGLNKAGTAALPSMSFQESNSLPASFNLSHRNYYKLVRDHKGWDLEFEYETKDGAKHTNEFNNVYIQRLLNINNGTRGTTISMPLSAPKLNDLSAEASDKEQQLVRDNIIGADVILPSLTLGEPPPYDFIYMVVDRSSGDVLFHNDSSRSLVENLYFSGDISSPLGQWLRAGLDGALWNNTLVPGNYHGQDGRFAMSGTIVDNWAVVVFYPNDSLQTYMTNQFIYIATTFTAIICLMVICIYGVRHFVWTSTLKQKLNLPAKLNVRLVILVSSVLFAASYCLYIVGYNLGVMLGKNADDWSDILQITGLLIATLVVYRGCYNHFCYPLPQVSNDIQLSAKTGSKRLIGAVLVAVAIHATYLQSTADKPQQSLDFHYQQLACNWLNYERQELISIGLSRYPNSITSKRLLPTDLLPMNEDWRKRVTSKVNGCDGHSSQVYPEDYPNLSSVFGTTYTWQWINIYLLDKDIFSQSEFKSGFSKFEKKDFIGPGKQISSTVIFAIVLCLLIWGWFRFNTRVLWNKLYCPQRFLQHIQRMTKSVHTLGFEERNYDLVIECDTIKLNGIGLALLLRTMNSSKKNQSDRLLNGFSSLFELSPSLQKFSSENKFLLNLKINLTTKPGSELMHVELWDIETCLEKNEFRTHLLDLILELKSLTLSKQLGSFTIFAGFHSLQRVKMKDPLSTDEYGILDHTEYLSWAECLMDFIVKVPESFKQGIDWQMLKDEVSAFPELEFLNQEHEDQHKQDSWTQIWKRDEELNLESRWATINYILLNAEALYRFKWESCSQAEKLALVNLAKHRKLNPTNTQMIEHLALNGLITVHKGHLGIINRSFAHFVLHAETSTTLNQLMQQGEAGLWKNYKLPLGIMILLIIGGIALTSGESIYIIAASMAGILGTIASVTNSANLLRGQMKD